MRSSLLVLRVSAAQAVIMRLPPCRIARCRVFASDRIRLPPSEICQKRCFRPFCLLVARNGGVPKSGCACIEHDANYGAVELLRTLAYAAAGLRRLWAGSSRCHSKNSELHEELIAWHDESP